jgi:SnoaL-like domain
MTDATWAFELVLAAWNERDPAKRRALLNKAVSPDVEFTDPLHKFVGIDAFEAMMDAFQQKYPTAQSIRTSNIDLHHDRARYHWRIVAGGVTVVDGFDAVALNAEGRFIRIDGYFGLMAML